MSSLFKASSAYERAVSYLLRNAANGRERPSLAAKILNDLGDGAKLEGGGGEIFNVKRLLRPRGFRKMRGRVSVFAAGFTNLIVEPGISGRINI